MIKKDLVSGGGAQRVHTLVSKNVNCLGIYKKYGSRAGVWGKNWESGDICRVGDAKNIL